MPQARHVDAAAAGAGTHVLLECPSGENPKLLFRPRDPFIGDRVLRVDGQPREYVAAGGGSWVLQAGHVVEVAQLGGGDSQYAHGIKLKNAAGKITRDFMPVDSWKHEDGAAIIAPVMRGTICKKCQKTTKSFPMHRFKCPCGAEILSPGEKPQPVREKQAGGRWPVPMKVPVGFTVSLAKQLVETVKGIPTRHQKFTCVDMASSPREMPDDASIQAGMRLRLEVNRAPFLELNERLNRTDSSKVRLAKEASHAPWEGDFVLHCISSDKEPGLHGSGGFGSVYRCRRRGAPPDTGELFAIKQLQKSRVSETYSQVRQTLVEICCSMVLPRHPHLIHIDEVRHDRDRIYHIMPLIRGIELHGVIQDRALQQKLTQQPVVARLMRQLLSALQHLHNKGIAHRDVKPENILCDPENQFHITLIDLGLARFWGDPVAQTPGGVAGLPSTAHLSAGEVDFGDPDDPVVSGTDADQARVMAQKTLLDYTTTPGAMTVAYAAVEAILSALTQTEDRKRRQLPSMDIYGAGATCFACLVRMVPFLRMSEMNSLPPREWMNRMARRAKRGIEAERGWDVIQGMLDPDGCRFMQRLMDPDIGKRYSAAQALNDPWLKRHSAPADVCMPLATPMPESMRQPQQPRPRSDSQSPRAADAAAPRKVLLKRPAEDHMIDGGDDLDDQEQAELLTVLPGGGRQLKEEGRTDA
eukprot:TRINITY_DN608_c2_g1_i1.p1 TRINITY_DN608_c2_g1~~TRINITY_DN608_c2_g1_i1.p1  ORF type:complete len:697 (+),score=189.12 TRINITY_DN608_c2_g1_i1:103-2193(+)